VTSLTLPAREARRAETADQAIPTAKRKERIERVLVEGLPRKERK
jgi:hypothetical protein